MVNRLVSVNEDLELPPEVQAQLTSNFETHFESLADSAEASSASASAAALEAENDANAADQARIAAENAAGQATAPTDDMVANLLTTPTSASGIVFSQRAIQFNVKAYGAIGDGVADDTAALNAAFSACTAHIGDGRVFIPAGTYRTTGTVNMTTAVDGSQATIRYAGTGTAVLAGNPTPGGAVSRVRMELPRVILTTRPSSSTWDGTSVGVKVNNTNGCSIYIPFVQDFEFGVLMYGDDAACAYNTIFLGALWNNHVNMWLDCTDVGYTNQNTFIGGRFQQTLTSGAVDEDTSAYQLRLGRLDAVKVINNNTWIGTSFEGDNPAYYRLWCEGRYNNFYNCRWECYNDTQSRVYWGPRSYGNIIHGGYESFKLQQVIANGAYSNTIIDERGQYARATKTANQAVGTGTGWTSVIWESSTQRRAAKNVDNTSWVPEPGAWQINVTVGFSGNATGYRGARILLGGGTTLAQSQTAPAGTDLTTLTLSAIGVFNGTQALTVQVRQTSGASLNVVGTTAGYAMLSAQRIGVEGPPGF